MTLYIYFNEENPNLIQLMLNNNNNNNNNNYNYNVQNGTCLTWLASSNKGDAYGL